MGIGLLLFVPASVPCASAAETPSSFPIKPSADGLYLVHQEDRPYFYHADTAWTVAKKLKLEEVSEYLDDREARGSTAIHVHAFSKEQGPLADREGREPFSPPGDIRKPNEAYRRGLDRIIEAARSRGMLVSLSAIWIRWGGRDREGWRHNLTDENARDYGRFLDRRFAREVLRAAATRRAQSLNSIGSPRVVERPRHPLHLATPRRGERPRTAPSVPCRPQGIRGTRDMNRMSGHLPSDPRRSRSTAVAARVHWQRGS